MAQWCSIGFLDNTYIPDVSILPFDLGNNISIGVIPDWCKTDDIVKDLGEVYGRYVSGGAYSLYSYYEAGPAFGDNDGIQSKKDEALLFSNIALWLATPSGTASVVGFHSKKEEVGWFRAQCQIYQRLLSNKAHQYKKHTHKGLIRARELNIKIAEIKRTGSFWTALRILPVALRQREWELRYLMFWVLLEALVGPDSSGEISFRISMRISALLSRSVNRRKKIFK